jgi:hypothetical protein
MTRPEFRSDLDLAPLVGLTFDAFAQTDNYWHFFVALRVTNGDSLVFTTEEFGIGPRFEVFALRVQREAVQEVWRGLPQPFKASSARPLWRNEWTESGASGPALGVDPATHYAGRGPVPPHALSQARVLAGVLFADPDGSRIIISASDSAPFNVEIFVDPGDVDEALNRFEPLPESR